MINTAAAFTGGTTMDPLTIILVVLGWATYSVLIYAAGHIQGQNGAKMKSDKWWSKHDSHLKSLEEDRHNRAVKGGLKAHKTQKRRFGRAGDTVTGTECNL